MGISPLTQGGLDEAPGLAVGPERIGFGADMLEAQCPAGLVEVLGFVA